MAISFSRASAQGGISTTPWDATPILLDDAGQPTNSVPIQTGDVRYGASGNFNGNAGCRCPFGGSFTAIGTCP